METFLLIVLSLAVLLLGWRCYRWRRAVGQQIKLFQSDTPPSLRDVASIPQPEPLADLGELILDLVTEASMRSNADANQRRFLEAVLNDIEDLIFILDEHLEIRFSNKAAKVVFPTDIPHEGRPLIEVCLDHRIVDAVNQATEAGTLYKDTLNMSRRGLDRQDHTYLMEAEPLQTGLGIEPGTWILLRDITLQRETEQIRRDFIANASHELRTPLSIINGYLEMLDGEDVTDSAAAKRAIHTMRKHGDRISRIVEDMLTISKLESPQDLLNRDYFDFADCVASITEHLHPLIEQREAEIILDFPEGDRSFYGDRFYWDQVFFNLVENALKQNHSPGLKIKIRLKCLENQFIIDVFDNGVGIPGTALPHIFKRFYRVEKHHSTQQVKGTGLGLSIVRRAVEAHGGTISVKSRPGIETVFSIKVPARPEAEAPVTAPVS